jgi:8-oxo-dGTP diphosphatase
VSTSRLRVCGVILRDDKILMVQHQDRGRIYWTLPGGGVESGETPQQAVVREAWEETGLSASVVQFLFSEPYNHGLCECYLLEISETDEPVLGADPEEMKLSTEEKKLQSVAWKPIDSLSEDRQIVQVLGALEGVL